MSASPSIPAGLPVLIRVAPKPALRAKKKAHNVFYDDPGSPDKSDAYDHLLRNIDGGIVLRKKKKFEAPVLDQDNPVFDCVYSKANHGERPKKELDLSHSQPNQRARLTELIKKYWCVFNEHGTFVPVRHYQCIINTGSSTPIAVKQICYGQQEIPIMEKSIAALEKMGQICHNFFVERVK